jgi:hypothetical protein
MTTDHITIMPANQMCVLEDNLYIAVYGTSQPFELWKAQGSAWVNAGVIDASTHGAGGQLHGGGALCAVSGKLYSFNHRVGADSWTAREITLDSAGNLLSSVDVSSIVLPASLLALNTQPQSLGQIRIDTVTDPLNPIYELLISEVNNEGENMHLYRWENAPSGQMTLVAQGMDAVRYTTISTNDGTGGGRVWTGSGTLNVSQPCMSINLNAVEIDAEFTLYGPLPVVSGVSMELYFDKDGGVCESRGTIVNTSHGSLSGNAVVGLTADNITKVTVGWAAVTDGIVSGDNPTLAARVFVP